jgi:hypothetical protein
VPFEHKSHSFQFLAPGIHGHPLKAGQKWVPPGNSMELGRTCMAQHFVCQHKIVSGVGPIYSKTEH